MDDTWRVLQALGAGPALPNRFNTLERLLESAVKSVRLKSTPELQMSGILAFCEEMQRILKIAFMGMRIPQAQKCVCVRAGACVGHCTLYLRVSVLPTPGHCVS